MELSQMISALFLDIGGVLLTNGWDSNARERACRTFGLDLDEFNERHHLTFSTYEEGKLSLDEYLRRTVFYQRRNFSIEEYKDFMAEQSSAYPEMLELVSTLKAKHQLKVAAVSNEGRELTEYRIHEFGLGSFIDFFVCSCFVNFRKPDEDIFRMALDIAQAKPSETVYIDDRAMFVEVADNMGMHSIHHIAFRSTREALASMGLVS
jgi:putative hydrolase of the HAD superfamily